MQQCINGAADAVRRAAKMRCSYINLAFKVYRFSFSKIEQFKSGTTSNMQQFNVNIWYIAVVKPTHVLCDQSVDAVVTRESSMLPKMLLSTGAARAALMTPSPGGAI